MLLPRIHNLSFRGKVVMADPGQPYKKMEDRNIGIVVNVTSKFKGLGRGEWRSR